MRLCTRCAEKERKDNGGRQDAPGLWSFPIAPRSRCNECQAQANGFSICAACATEKCRCQGCYTRIASSTTLLAEIAEHRLTLARTKEAALVHYAETIEPYKDDAAKLEAGIADSEAQRNADCQPFWDAAQEADEKYRRTDHNTPTDVRREVCDAYFAARKASEENTSKQFDRERERNRALRAAFAQYDSHYKAVRLRDRTIERADATFEAAVELSIGISHADDARQVAVNKAQERYKRSLDMQDSLDRMLEVI